MANWNGLNGYRTGLFASVAAAAMVVTACGGAATETPAAPETDASAAVETPAAIETEETTAVSADATPDSASTATAETMEVADAGDDAALVEAEAEADHDHGDDHDHDHDEDHDHDGEHEHDEDHDHDHDHAGGQAHVHGVADAAVVREDQLLTISFKTPLASVGLNETEPTDADIAASLDAALAPFATAGHLVSLPEAAGCTLDDPSVERDYSGGPGDLVIDLIYTCTDPEAVESVDFTVFSSYDTLETIDAVWLSEGTQTAATLTPSETTLAP